MSKSMQFIDLHAQQVKMGKGLKDAIERVLTHGRYILGPEIDELEVRLSEFAEVAHTITCANGTDALQMPLMAWGIGPGDAVFCPSFTFASTGEVVALVGAEPVMVDIQPDTFNIDPRDLEAAIAAVKSEGRLRPRAIIAVDLFGLPAQYPQIAAIARDNDLKLIADSAQAFGSTLNNRHPVSWADAATTSFFPAKPLGCYGDGGAVFTNDKDLAQCLRSIRNHGMGEERFDNIQIGLNSRLDSIQAAILLEKLVLFPYEIELRNQVAARYSAHLHNIVETPFIPTDATSVWAQYTVKTDDRDGLAAALKSDGIPTAVYYARPMHQQTAYRGFAQSPSGLPISSELSGVVISLPMHPYLSESDQDRVIDGIHRFLKK